MARGWTLAAMAVWTGFVINGFFEWNFGDQEIVTALYFVCGLALALPTRLCAATFAAHRAAQSDHGSNAQRFQDG
jgi:hypothetical protein